MPYLELRHRRREYEAPPAQVREHSLHEPQASHSVSLSSSERAVRELYTTEEETRLEEERRHTVYANCHGWYGHVQFHIITLSLCAGWDKTHSAVTQMPFTAGNVLNYLSKQLYKDPLTHVTCWKWVIFPQRALGIFLNHLELIRVVASSCKANPNSAFSNYLMRAHKKAPLPVRAWIPKNCWKQNSSACDRIRHMVRGSNQKLSTFAPRAYFSCLSHPV